MRCEVSWLLLAGTAPAIVLGASVRRAAGGAALGATPGLDLVEACGPVFAALLVTAALMLVILLFSLEYSRPRPPAGDVEHLLGRKQLFTRLAGRVRGNTTWRGPRAAAPGGLEGAVQPPNVQARPGHWPTGSSGGLASAIQPQPSPTENVLDVLVRVKRRGAWERPHPG